MISSYEIVNYIKYNNVTINDGVASIDFDRFTPLTTVQKNAETAIEPLKSVSNLEDFQSFFKEKSEEDAHSWRDFEIRFEFVVTYRKQGNEPPGTGFLEAIIGIREIAYLEIPELKNLIIGEIVNDDVIKNPHT